MLYLINTKKCFIFVDAIATDKITINDSLNSGHVIGNRGNENPCSSLLNNGNDNNFPEYCV